MGQGAGAVESRQAARCCLVDMKNVDDGSRGGVNCRHGLVDWRQEGRIRPNHGAANLASREPGQRKNVKRDCSNPLGPSQSAAALIRDSALTPAATRTRTLAPLPAANC